MKYEEILEMLGTMGSAEHKEFIMALIAHEKGIEDKELVKKVYDKFIDADYIELLNDDFDGLIAHAEKKMESNV